MSLSCLCLRNLKRIFQTARNNVTWEKPSPGGISGVPANFSQAVQPRKNDSETMCYIRFYYLRCSVVRTLMTGHRSYNTYISHCNFWIFFFSRWTPCIASAATHCIQTVYNKEMDGWARFTVAQPQGLRSLESTGTFLQLPSAVS